MNLSHQELESLLGTIMNLQKSLPKKPSTSRLECPKTKEELLKADYKDLNIMDQITVNLFKEHADMTLEEATELLDMIRS